MDKLNDMYNWVSQHKAALSLALGWFIHMGFPALQRYCQSRDGGVVPNLFLKAFGKPNPISQNESADKPKTNI